MKVLVTLLALLCARNMTMAALVPMVDCPCYQTTPRPLNQTEIEYCNIFNFLNDSGYTNIINPQFILSNVCSQYSVSKLYTMCLRTNFKQCFKSNNLDDK